MKGLVLLAPKGLWALGLLAPLVALYILKVRRERRRVASTWLFAAAQRDLLAKAPFQRLRAQLPLLLEALALALLALAFARPATRGPGVLGDHVAIVVDASASMLAVEPGSGGEPTTRIALAREAAKRVLAGLPPGSDAMLIEAGVEPHVVAPLDRDLSRLRRAVDGLQAHAVEGELATSVALAIDRLRALGGTSRIVVITDGAFARPPGLAGAALPVDVLTVGAPVENAGIVRVDVRSGPDPITKKELVQAFVLVASFASAPREVFLTMRLANTTDVLASRRFVLPAGEKVPAVLSFAPARGDYRKGLVFELSPHDALDVDDVAFARVPAGDKLQVVLTSNGPPSVWLERALGSDPAADLLVANASVLSTTPIENDALIVADGVCPENAPGGDVLVVAPPVGRCFEATVGAAVEQPTVTSWESSDPRLRFLTLDGLSIAKANLLAPQSGRQELVRTDKGVIVADASTTARSITLVAFDVGESDWPLKASFVLFVRNLTELARSHRSLGAGGSARAGEPIRAGVPRTAKDVEAFGPLPLDPSAPPPPKLDVSTHAGLAIVPNATRVGLYRVDWKGPQPGSTLVPVNLTSSAESDVRPRPIEAGPAGVTVTPASDEASALTEWGWVAALLALALLLFDLYWVTRPPRRRALSGGAA